MSPLSRPVGAGPAPSVSGDLILDECQRGDGLWFDKGELEALLQALLGDDTPALDNVRGYLGEFTSVNRAPDDVGE